MHSSAHNLTQIQGQPSVFLWLPSSHLAFIMQESMPPSITRGRPKSTYYHNGIGGRGNYHKRDEKDPSLRQSRSHFAQSLAAYFCRGCSGNASKQHELEAGDSSSGTDRGFMIPSKWFTGTGAFGRSEAHRQHSSSSDMFATTVTPSDHTSQALPFGAAYVFRRKLLGELSALKLGKK